MTRNKVIEAAATVAESLSSTLARYKTRISRGPKLAAACVAATIADGLVAVIHVVDSHGQGHAPTLARGMIESMLDLEMVCTNADYLKPLRLATAQGKIAIGQQFLSQAKMLTKEQQDAVRAALREQALIVEDLERQGIKPLLKLPTFRGQFQAGTMALGGLCHGTQGTQAPYPGVQARGGAVGCRWRQDQGQGGARTGRSGKPVAPVAPGLRRRGAQRRSQARARHC